MTAAALSRDALMPRRPERLGPGLLLALLVHAGLIVGIAFSVNWRSHTPEAMEAELWAAVPQAAAPRAVEPEPRPQPVPKAAPKPEPKPAPSKVEQPPQPSPDAQIAIEKARREADKEKQRQAEEEAQAREREELRKKQAADKIAADKLSAEKLAAEKREAQQKKADEARLAAQREENIKRILGQAGASGDAHATGTAQQSAGPSASYAGRIVARVKPNIVFPDDLPGDPVAEVEVRLAPDGTVLGTPRLIKRSGIPAWDDAVVRAVVKTEVLPRDVDGRVFSPMVIAFRRRD